MPRIARAACPSGYFHIIVQGLDREHIFATNALKRAYLSNLAKYRGVFPSVGVLAYCVMGNHCHLIISAPSVEAVSEYMHRVNTRFAQYYNFASARTGYVFRDRFKSQFISDIRYLGACFAYVHNNPVRAGLAPDAEDYAFSSLGDYLAGMSNVIDFKKAAEVFDPSPDSVRAIMAEFTEAEKTMDCPVWLEAAEDIDPLPTLAKRACAAANVTIEELKHNREILRSVCIYLRDAGANASAIARCLGIERHRIGKLLAESPAD